MKKTVKRLICAVLSAAMVLLSCFGAFADDSMSEFDEFKKVVEILTLTHVDRPTEQGLYDAVVLALLNKHPELLGEMIGAMTSSLDRYSHYFATTEDYDRAYHSNQYVGVGCSIVINGENFEFEQVYDGGPADLAGIESGDVIAEVDGVAITASHTLTDVQSMLRGEAYTEVKVKVLRGSKTLEFTVLRQKVTVPDVEAAVLGSGSIGYISVASFTSVSTTFIDFANALDDMEDAGVDKIIIDLRNNPGGEINTVYFMLNLLVPEANVLLSTLETADGESEVTSGGNGHVFSDVVILVNENSYSGAEIFAGAAKDLGIATVIGHTTGGKGKGQSHIPVSDESVIAVSSLNIILPKTGKYDGIGIIPDITVDNEAVPVIVPDLFPIDYKNYLVPGSVSPVVLGVEQRLQILGYLNTKTVDSTFDQRSVDAVNAFQKDAGLTVTSTINRKTVNALNDAIVNYMNTATTLKDSQLEYAVNYLSQD